jgi:hypothetical protein
MTKIGGFAFIMVFILTGCGPSSPSVSLSEVNPVRIYSIDKSKILDAMRLFCHKKDFTLTGTEPETGRVTAYKKMETLREEESRTILMLLYIIKLPDGRSRVEAKFVYSKIEGTPTRQEETQLVECYTALFKYIDTEVN